MIDAAALGVLTVIPIIILGIIYSLFSHFKKKFSNKKSLEELIIEEGQQESTQNK